MRRRAQPGRHRSQEYPTAVREPRHPPREVGPSALRNRTAAVDRRACQAKKRWNPRRADLTVRMRTHGSGLVGLLTSNCKQDADNQPAGVTAIVTAPAVDIGRRQRAGRRTVRVRRRRCCYKSFDAWHRPFLRARSVPWYNATWKRRRATYGRAGGQQRVEYGRAWDGRARVPKAPTMCQPAEEHASHHHRCCFRRGAGSDGLSSERGIDGERAAASLHKHPSRPDRCEWCTGAETAAAPAAPLGEQGSNHAQLHVFQSFGPMGERNPIRLPHQGQE
jgi:hypothetical protein